LVEVGILALVEQQDQLQHKRELRFLLAEMAEQDQQHQTLVLLQQAEVLMDLPQIYPELLISTVEAVEAVSVLTTPALVAEI
jgi:hypothetical protein